jgi:signal transduction histidine kinase
MTTWQVDDVLDAAVHTLVNERCRRAYMHDMRGGLQAVYTSLEILARSARNELKDKALVDKASAMVKRAMAQHELALTDMFNQLAGPDDAVEIVDLPQMLQQAQHFLRNEALSRGVALRLSCNETVLLHTQRNKLRSLMLGLLGLAIDALPSGAELHIELSRSDSHALLELCSEVNYGVIREPEDLLCRPPANLKPQELVLAFTRHWILARGGRVEIDAGGGVQNILRIYYPLAAA